MAPTHTYLSVLNEVKGKFDLGKTEIILEKETQEDGKKIFWISLSLTGENALGIGVLGKGTSIKKAKQDGAWKMLKEIRKAARTPKQVLGQIARQVLLDCCSRLNRYSIMDENLPLNPVMELEMWCNARGHSLPKFNKMLMTSALTKVCWTSVECKWPNNGHLTRFGDGRSNRQSRNMAAFTIMEELLKLFPDFNAH